MAMVGVTKIGRGNAKYWIEAVAEGGEDYYAKPGEKPGEWIGELAAELGLEGEVDREAYFALLAGKHPVSGDVLVRRPEPRVFTDAAGKTRRLEPILGYDIRFSAPKSVSLLWAIGSPEVRALIEQCHNEAVAEALGYSERHACFVQRGRGGVKIEKGSGFISMNFLHRSSRAGDPALHSHVVTANMTRAASDNRWLSLANPKRESPLLREAKPTGYVYQAVLRSRITAKTGLEWGPVVNGYADLADLDRLLLDHFSRRRREIVAEMAEHGTSSAAAAEVAAFRTRDAKSYDVDPDGQREDWRAQAAEFGFTPDSIDRLLSQARIREPKPIAAPELDAALTALEQTHSHFDRRELLCALVDQLREGASATAIETAVDRLLDSDRLVEVHRGEGLLGTSYYTTPRLWQLEQRVLRAAREGEGAGAAVVDERTLTAVLARHRYLGEEQLAMVRRLTTGGERIVTVAALPGAGKTTALRAAREVWAEAGIPGLGVATARSASGELVDAGIKATSITALLIQAEEWAASGHRPLPPGTVIVMDESSTTSTPAMAAIVDLVEGCGGKLVCVGDPRQIGAVGPGGLYGTLTNLTDPVLLTEIRRQRERVDRGVVELAHQGRGSDALDVLRAEQRLVIADTVDQSLDALALDWYRAFAAGEDAVMIARRIRDVGDLNARAREFLRAEGHLGEKEVSVGGERFAAGERIVTRVNNSQVSNRERWEVVGVDAEQKYLKLRRLGGDERQVILGPEYLARRTERGEPAIQHAYALTTYATEGKTFESTFAFLDPGLSREDFLVAVSRNSGHVHAYGVAATVLLDADLGPATREITDEAHDIRAGAERVAGEYAAAEVGSRRRLDTRGVTELAARRAELVARLEVGQAPTPAADRLALLEKRIAEDADRLSALGGERVAAAGDRRRLALIETSERLTAKQLGRLEAEREDLRREAANEAGKAPRLRPEERHELALIEDRLLVDRRRAIAAERARPTRMIVDALGPRPESGRQAMLWNKGVDIIYTYRQQHGITASSGDPLGPKPNEAAQRQARLEAQRQLQRIQQALQLRQRQTRVIEQSHSIAR